MLPFNPLLIRLVSFDFRGTLSKTIKSPGDIYAKYALCNFPNAFISPGQTSNASQTLVNILGSRIDRVFPIAWHLHYGKHPNFGYGTADSLETLATFPPAPTDSRLWWTDLIRLCFVLEERRVHNERQRAVGEGAPLAPEEKTYFDSIAPILSEILSESNSEAFSSYCKSLYDLFATPEGWSLEAETRSVLEKLANTNRSLVVVSNFDERLPLILNAFGITNLFTSVVMSSVERVAKPEPFLYRLALQKVNARLFPPLDPSECLHIGDNVENDYETAWAAGWNALLLKPPGADENEFLGLDLHRARDGFLHHSAGGSFCSVQRPPAIRSVFYIESLRDLLPLLSIS